MPELPITSDSTVLVGTFESSQAVLSRSRCSIYTEARIRVDRILQSSAPGVRPGAAIWILAPGGSVRTRDGRVIDYGIDPDSFPLHPAGRYLLILRYESSLEAFSLAKAWNLTQRTAQPTASEDIRRAQDHTSRYTGMPEPEFLRAVEQQLRQ